MRKKPYLYFIAPGFLFYTVFVIIPAIYVIYLGLFDWGGIGEKTFIGLQNFKTILFSGEVISQNFWKALGNNGKYLACVWLIITPFQYMTAYLLYLKIPGHKYLKMMLYLPCIFSSAVVAFFVMRVFSPSMGILNEALNSVGLAELSSAWFGDPNLAFKLFVLVIMWAHGGSSIVILHANMLDLPQDVMEASLVDGCTEWQRFRYVLLPMTLPSCASVLMLNSISAFTIFDTPLMVAGINGGVSGKLDFITMVFYRATFGSGDDPTTEFGFGAALSTIIFAIIMIISIIQSKVINRMDYNNEGRKK